MLTLKWNEAAAVSVISIIQVEMVEESSLWKFKRDGQGIRLEENTCMHEE